MNCASRWTKIIIYFPPRGKKANTTGEIYLFCKASEDIISSSGNCPNTVSSSSWSLSFSGSTSQTEFGRITLTHHLITEMIQVSSSLQVVPVRLLQRICSIIFIIIAAIYCAKFQVAKLMPQNQKIIRNSTVLSSVTPVCHKYIIQCSPPQKAKISAFLLILPLITKCLPPK